MRSYVFIISELQQLTNCQNEFWTTPHFQTWSQSNTFTIFLLAEDLEKNQNKTPVCKEKTSQFTARIYICVLSPYVFSLPFPRCLTDVNCIRTDGRAIWDVAWFISSSTMIAFSLELQLLAENEQTNKKILFGGFSFHKSVLDFGVVFFCCCTHIQNLKTAFLFTCIYSSRVIFLICTQHAKADRTLSIHIWDLTANDPGC